VVAAWTLQKPNVDRIRPAPESAAAQGRERPTFGRFLPSTPAATPDHNLCGVLGSDRQPEVCGGSIASGGGVPLYRNRTRAGGLGVSGDTACADHEIAKRIRHLASLDPEKGEFADDVAQWSEAGRRNAGAGLLTSPGLTSIDRPDDRQSASGVLATRQ
jgi:hypothetical protein